MKWLDKVLYVATRCLKSSCLFCPEARPFHFEAKFPSPFCSGAIYKWNFHQQNRHHNWHRNQLPQYGQGLYPNDPSIGMPRRMVQSPKSVPSQVQIPFWSSKKLQFLQANFSVRLSFPKQISNFQYNPAREGVIIDQDLIVIFPLGRFY